MTQCPNHKPIYEHLIETLCRAMNANTNLSVDNITGADLTFGKGVEVLEKMTKRIRTWHIRHFEVAINTYSSGISTEQCER